MRNERILITGATGLVGSSVAREAVHKGYAVRLMVREGADRSLLQGLDAEYVLGDLDDVNSLKPAVEGMDFVVHAAARIGDWGPADRYRATNVVALEHMLATALESGRLRRWVQISSLGVYPARDHYGTDETASPDLNGLDGYTRTKAEAELIVQRYIDMHGLPAVILRPGFIYGRGERHVVPQIIQRLKQGTMKMIGDGRKLLNNTHVCNLTEAVFLAMEKDAAVGQTFNVRDARLVTRLEYVQMICDYAGRPMPRRVPLAIARLLVGPIEWAARLTGRREAPILTRARIKFMAMNLDYSIEKARRLLGYQGKRDFQEGMREALEWIAARDRFVPQPALAQ